MSEQRTCCRCKAIVGEGDGHWCDPDASTQPQQDPMEVARQIITASSDAGMDEGERPIRSLLIKNIAQAILAERQEVDRQTEKLCYENAALEAELADLRQVAHHHPLCNSSDKHPIGAVGVTCSCRVVHNSEWRELEQVAQGLNKENDRLLDELNSYGYEGQRKEIADLTAKLAVATEALKDPCQCYTGNRIAHDTRTCHQGEALAQIEGTKGDHNEAS